jgi:hypothetical protein
MFEDVKLEYLVLTGEQEPGSPFLRAPAALWKSAKGWFYFNSKSWSPVLKNTTHALPIHPIRPGLRLYYEDTWRRPFWLSQSGYDRQRGALNMPNHQNSWLLTLLECWESMGYRSCQASSIKDTLIFLASREETLKTYPVINDTLGMFENPDTNPTKAQTLASLREATTEDYDNNIVALDGNSENLQLSDFLEVFENPRDARRQLQIPILRSSKIIKPGSLSDWKFQLPFHLRSETRTLSPEIAPSVPDTPHQEATFVCPGFVMSTHIDKFLVPDIVIHVTGLKLWMIWPATLENMKKAKHHILGDTSKVFDGDINRAIRELDGLTLLLVKEPHTTFILPPGFLHAVITFEPSVHLSGWYLDLAMFDENIQIFDQYLDMLESEWKIVQESILNSDYFCKLDFAKTQFYRFHFENIVIWHNLFLEFEKKTVSRQVSKLRTSARRFVKILNLFHAETTAKRCLSTAEMVIFKDLVGNNKQSR